MRRGEEGRGGEREQTAALERIDMRCICACVHCVPARVFVGALL